MAELVKKQVLEKRETIADLKGDLNDLSIAFVTDYRGLTVAEMTELRRELAKEGAKMRVVKNTLMKLAVDGTPLEEFKAFLKGPSAVVIGTNDPVAPVKAVKEFYKKNKKENDVRGGFLDGKLLSAKDIDQLASLPPLIELRGKLVGALAYPQNRLVSALGSQQRSLVYILSQVAEQKQAAGA